MNRIEKEKNPVPVPIEKGTINLKKWSVRHKNKDGSISTLLSFSTNINGKEVLLPSFTPNGKKLTTKQAIDQYRATGKHLGKFNTPREASIYANWLHEQEAQKIQKPQQPKTKLIGN